MGTSTIRSRRRDARNAGGDARRRRGLAGLALFPLLVSPGAGAPAAQTSGEAGLTGGERWGADYFPNVRLTTHEGDAVRFFDDLIKDKVVVINFMYTSCPDVCPLETAKLAELQAILGDRVGRDVFLYSITIDPKIDTPLVLREYAERYGARPGWQFLTGADVAALIEYLDAESRRVAPFERSTAGGADDPDSPVATCCRKDESAVLAAQAPAAGSGDDAEGGGAVTAVFLRSSFGLGFFFLALAGLVRWRSSPPGGEPRSPFGGGAVGPAPSE